VVKLILFTKGRNSCYYNVAGTILFVPE